LLPVALKYDPKYSRRNTWVSLAVRLYAFYSLYSQKHATLDNQKSTLPNITCQTMMNDV